MRSTLGIHTAAYLKEYYTQTYRQTYDNTSYTGMTILMYYTSDVDWAQPYSKHF